MSRRVAVLQSNYIPWKGYFDLLHDVDLFIFHDDLQYTKQDWRNRNRIKTSTGPAWLTVPVGIHQDRLICEVAIADRRWAGRHWRRLQQHYGQAPHFERYRPYFEHIYCGNTWTGLSALNQRLIGDIARDFLGIRTVLRDSREYHAQGRKLDRLLDLLVKAKATSYVSGPAARAYIEPRRFEEAGIELCWKDYSDYPPYPQLHTAFLHQVSIVDLLFQVGPEAPFYIWGHRVEASGDATDTRGPASSRRDALAP